MKALLCTSFGPLEKLTIQEIPKPRPGPGQVLLDVKASSLNFPDALMAQGLYQVKPPLPFSPGTEMAGVIVETGAEVQGFKPGDRVIAISGWGGFAEECAVDAGGLIPMPEGLDFDTGNIPKIPINLALLKERSVVGTYLAESVKHDPEGHLRNVEQLVEWLAAGKVKPVISERVPLSEAAAAMKRMINRQVKGKVVILPEA